MVIDSTHLNQQDIDAIRQRFERLLGTGAYTPDIVVTQVGSLLYTKGLFSLCKKQDAGRPYLHLRQKRKREECLHAKQA